MDVKERQNIFDVTLNSYGGLDFIVKACNDNGFLIDELPPTQKEVIADQNVGVKRVKIFVAENDFIYVNEGIEKTAILLAADNTALSPATDIQFIYK